MKSKKSVLKMLVALFACISVHKDYTMLSIDVESAPIASHVKNIIDTIYQIHNLSKQASGIKFYVSYSKEMLQESNVNFQTGTIYGPGALWGFNDDGFVLSSCLTTMIERSKIVRTEKIELQAYPAAVF